jgi:tetratricopeptide (TPR) repeat protein
MKLISRQKKEIFAFSILIVLIVLMVIYQGHLKKEYLRKKEVAIIQWSPVRTIDDFRQEISNITLENISTGEKCFQEGTDLLKKARILLDRNLFLKAQKALECANNASPSYSTIFNLGICFFYLEDFPRAGDLFLRASQIRPNAYGAENFLGLCMVNTGHWKEGMNRLSSALKKARDQKDQPWKAVILSNIGVVYKHMGNFNEAEKYHDLSLMLCQKIGYKRGEAGELINLAHLSASLGDADRAFRIFDNALIAYRKISDGRGEASTLSYIARLYQERQDVVNAKKFYKQSLEVSSRIGYRLGTADAQVELGTIAYWQKKTDQALSYFLQAGECYRQAGFPEGTSALLSNLGIIYKDKKDYRTALEYYQKALRIDRSTGYLQGEAHDLNQIGIIYELAGQDTKALDTYRQARNLFESLQLNDRVKEIDDRIKGLSPPVLSP